MFTRLFILFSIGSLCAELKHPADVSYLVADFKYSQQHGLKICEVQHGALSAVTGDLYLSGGDGAISPRVADFFSSFPIKKWAVGFLYAPLKRAFAAKEWEIQDSMNHLLKDPAFLQCAKTPPIDPFSIASYGGIVYGACNVIHNFDFYRKAYPGILFIDEATFPFWKNKYKMSALFDQSEELKQFKADWRLYPKKYDPLLHIKIQEDMPSEFYVIKPKKQCLANGVIVVANADLDATLQFILTPSEALRKHPDKKYTYWQTSGEDSFLIEKYYPSDFFTFTSPLSLSPQLYDATLRLAFILQCSEGQLSYHCLGGFWKLPPKSLDEEGTLNEKTISLCEPPFYAPIDPELFVEINPQMERAMLLLYEVMLKR